MSDKLQIVLSFLRNSYSLSPLWIITCFIRISVIANKAITGRRSSNCNSQFNFDGYDFTMREEESLSFSLCPFCAHDRGRAERAHFTYPRHLRRAGGLGTEQHTAQALYSPLEHFRDIFVLTDHFNTSRSKTSGLKDASILPDKSYTSGQNKMLII